MMCVANPRDQSDEPVPPVRGVVDINAFARGTVMPRLTAAAKNYHLELIWSPYIIAEASRLFTWLWLGRHGPDLSNAAKRAHSAAARRWFETMTTVFRVVDDRPPQEPLWTETPRDPHDRPIWTAAVRARAHVVITDNLRDGPPPDHQGLRRWDGILYATPDHVVKALDWWEGVAAEEAAYDAPTTPDVPPLLLAIERAVLGLPPASGSPA